MTGLILQARIGSTRLKNKALLPMCGVPMIELVMRALKHIHADSYVLATEEESLSTLSPIAEEMGFLVFSGPKDDVLKRYALCTEKYNFSTIVRATGDNPLVSVTLANDLLELAQKEKSDYAGFLAMPKGMGVEVISSTALLKAQDEAESSFHREHVAPYLYQNPNLFKILQPTVSKEYFLPNESVTVDTLEDFQNVEKIFAHFGIDKLIDTLSVIDYLKQNNSQTKGEHHE